MSAIHNALQNLNHVVVKLESAIEGIEQERAGEQREMFLSASNENDQKVVDGQDIARRLDSAIEKVEKLLQDDAAA